MAKKTLVLDEKQIEEISKMSGIGLNLEQIAYIIGVAPKTMDRLIERDERVKDAVENGKASASAAVMSTAFKMATDGKNPAMTIFWLKCRQRWRESNPLEVDGKPNQLTLSYKLDDDQ